MAGLAKITYNFSMELFHYWSVELADPRALSYPLIVSSQWPVMGLLTVYFYFVKIIGRKFMENRKPFDLSWVMAIFNLCQSIANGILFILIVRSLLRLNYPISCIEIRYGTDEESMWCLRLTYYYYMLRLCDLLDTVFMVFRKNYHQISFLHIYHHIGISIGSWAYTKYYPGGQGTLMALCNTFVHCIMYLYYMVSAVYPEIKKSVGLKRNITRIQLLQFFIVIIGVTPAVLNPNCHQPKIPLVIMLSQAMVMIYLFLGFYYQAYISPKVKEIIKQTNKKGTILEINQKDKSD